MFSEADKRIFKSPTGSFYDPLTVKRKLTIATAGKLNDLVNTFNEAPSDLSKAQAEDALLVASRVAFDLKPFTETGGVPDHVVFDHLQAFLEFL